MGLLFGAREKAAQPHHVTARCGFFTQKAFFEAIYYGRYTVE